MSRYLSLTVQTRGLGVTGVIALGNQLLTEGALSKTGIGSHSNSVTEKQVVQCNSSGTSVKPASVSLRAPNSQRIIKWGFAINVPVFVAFTT